MSEFSDVDSSAQPARLVAYLDRVGLTAMRQYIAASHKERDTALVLDVGCGIGRDLAVLADVGVAAIGVDPSSFMLRAAACRVSAPLARASGEQLPFADDVFSGCVMQRVLMHVDDPAMVIAEAVRCVQPNGVVTIFEPDWSTLRVNGSHLPAWWINTAKHPFIGAQVGELLTATGCTIRDRVEERSWWTFNDFDRIVNLRQRMHRAVEVGIATRRDVDTWLVEQHRRSAANDFRAEMAKILWVATTGAEALPPSQ